MRLTLARSGGFAGVTMVASLELSDLPPEEARSVRRSVHAAPASVPRAVSVDRFAYDLTVEEKGGRRELHYVEPDIPPGMAVVIEALMARATIA